MSHPELTWQELLDRFTSRCCKNVLRNIAACQDLTEKVNLCLSDESAKESIIKWVKHRIKTNKFIKSSERSTCLRQEGNKIFAGANPDQALDLYTKAVVTAPHNSDQLRLAYGNLSAVLFYMERFKDCVTVIDLSLTSEKDIRCLKLQLRKCKAYLHLGKVQESSNQLTKAQTIYKAVTESHCNKTELLKFERELDNCARNIRSAFEADESLKPKDDQEFNKPDILKNPLFPFASEHVMLKKSEEKGRYVIAKKKLKFGSVIFTEKPVAFVVLSQYRLYYCNHCCHPIKCPVPCNDCSGLVYCGESCRDNAYSYHKYECNGGLSIAYSTGIAHLALRLALIKPLDPSGYGRVSSLLHHMELMPPEDVYNYALTGYALSLYLEEVNFCKSSESVVDLTLDIGRLITNGHSIDDIRTSDNSDSHRIAIETEDKVATAIYPSASMMNHSCRSNIANCFYGQYLIVRTNKDVEKDGEIFNCYGIDCFRNSRRERRDVLLSQYKFSCNCDACTSLLDPYETYVAYSCNKCHGPVINNTCVHCSYHQVINKHTTKLLEEADERYSLGLEYFKRDRSKALEIFEEVLEIKNKYLYKYHKDIGLLYDKIIKCFSAVGNYNKGYNLLKEESIPRVSEWFGSDSIELANVMNNAINLFSSIIMNKYGANSPECDLQDCVELLECVKMIEKVETLYNIYYGPWSDKYRKLMKYKRFLVPLSQVWSYFLQNKQKS